jgi:transposase
MERAIESRLRGEQLLFAPDLPAEVREVLDDIVRRIERAGGWLRGSTERPGAQAREVRPQRAERTVDGVLVERVTHTDTAQLGVSLLGLHAWTKLQMPELLAAIGFNATQRHAAAAAVVNRLDEPTSENGLPDWIRHSSLPDLLGEDILRGGEDRFYRISDKLLEKRDRIEEHLRRRQAQLFNLHRTVLLYDLTNSHFEGTCDANPKAVRGINKQKRDDCPQIVVGMVFDEKGFELAHRTFKGNTHDAQTLLTMIEELRKASTPDDALAAAIKPLVIMDSGVATAANRRQLRRHGFSYLVNDTRPGRRKWRQEFVQDGFQAIPGRDHKTAVSVRFVDIESEEQTEDGTQVKIQERLVLCRSEGRREKESAIRSKAEERFVEALEALATRIHSGRLKDQAKIQRAIGRVLQKNPRVARYYIVTAKPPEGTAPAAGMPQLQWQRRDELWHGDEELLGCYVLRSDRRDLPAEELWQLYMTLCHAEDGFQSLKSDLGLRPNPHQIEDRVDAHVFITVIAYHLLRYIEQILAEHDDTRSWLTIRRLLQTHCYTTILMPTSDGKLYRLRRPGQPEACQQDIYRHFGITIAGLPTSELVVDQGTPATL